MSSADTLKERLIKLQGKIETIEAIEREKGERFNIFSILDMERLEVKTHSSFIYELLNPQGLHNQGEKYLKIFIKNILNINEFKYVNVRVVREDYYADEGRIDLTIENNEMFVAVEIKIDASDQDKQIERYLKIAKRKAANFKVYYLTLDGRDADDQSVGATMKDNIRKEYSNLSFADDVLKWIEMCIEGSATLPIVRESLVQYANLVKKITGKTSEEITMEVIEMVDNPKIAEAATIMAQNIGYAWAEKEAVFWKDLLDRLEPELEKKGWELVLEDVYYNLFYENNNEWKNLKDISNAIYKHRKNKDNDIEFQFIKKINKLDIALRLYQYNSQDTLYYQLDEIVDISIDRFNGLAKQLDVSRKNKENRYDASRVAVNFYGKGVAEPTYDLFDDKKLNILVEEAEKEVLDKLNIIDEYLLNGKND